MRALLAIAAVAGCGLQEPTGAPQTWPPPLGVSIESVATADLDGDGISELVAYSTGNNAGAYLIEGTQATAAGLMPDGFTAFSSQPFNTQVAGAMFVAGNAGQVVAAYGAAGTVDIVKFDAHLDASNPAQTELAAAGTVLWVAPSRRSDGTYDLLIGNGTEVHYISGDGDTETTIATNLPAPVLVATTFYLLGERKILAANATDAETTTLNTDGTIGAWTNIRSGAAWLAQTPFDVDGDGQPELLALDPAANSLCMLYLTDGSSGCVSTGDTTNGGVTTLVPGTFAGGTGADVAIVQSGATFAEVGLVQDIAYDGFDFTGAGQGAVVPQASISSAHPARLTRGPGHHDALLLVGRAGTLSCTFCD